MYTTSEISPLPLLSSSPFTLSKAISRRSGRMSAGDITDHFDVTAASISRHLSVLKEADLIRDTREGKYIYYELNASVLEEILLWISELKGETNHD